MTASGAPAPDPRPTSDGAGAPRPAPLRVAVLASGEGTNLQALLDGLPAGEAQVVAVGSDRPEARALRRAALAGVPTRAFARDAHPDRAARDAAVVAWLRDAGADLVVLAGYMALISPGFVAAFPDRIVNVHPSLLPAFPGLRAVEQALDRGVRVVGATVHLVDDGVDTGAILAQEALPVPPGADADALTALLHPVEHRLLVGVVRAFAAGAVARDPARPGVVVVGAPAVGRLPG